MEQVAADPIDPTAQAVGNVSGAVVRVDGRSRRAASGVVWNPDGVIVTANHVLQRDDGLEVGLADGRALEAALVGRDAATDLALLRVAEVGTPAATWSSLEDVCIGQMVMAVARPEAEAEAALGVVGVLGGAWRTPFGGTVEALVRMDRSIPPGFSGGALVGWDGRLLGVLTSGLSSGRAVALPTATVNRVTAALLEHGRIRRGYLGVNVQAARLAGTAVDQAGQEAALVVVGVQPGSPAQDAGVCVGDLLLGLAGSMLLVVDDLMDVLTTDNIGRRLRLRLLRGGSVVEMLVDVVDRPR